MIRNLLALIGFVAVALVAAGAAWVYLGRVEVSADGEDFEPVRWFLEYTRERAVERAAEGINARLPDLSDESDLLEAVMGYEDMCAACHTPPGETHSALARGLNPRAPGLAVSARHRTPEELFWVTKHGIRMTGMPAWGVTHGDEELWSIVALLTRFPEFADDEYSRLLEAARAAGVEHVHNHDHHDHHEHEDTQSDDEHEHDDHH